LLPEIHSGSITQPQFYITLACYINYHLMLTYLHATFFFSHPSAFVLLAPILVFLILTQDLSLSFSLETCHDCKYIYHAQSVMEQPHCDWSILLFVRWFHFFV